MDLSLSRKGDAEGEEEKTTNNEEIVEITEEAQASSEIIAENASTPPHSDELVNTNHLSAPSSPTHSLNLSNKRSREEDEDVVPELNGSLENNVARPCSRRRLSSGTEETNHGVNNSNKHSKPRVNGLTNGYSSDGDTTVPAKETSEDDVLDNDDEEDVDDHERMTCSSPPMKELLPEELAEKMKMIHRLQVELRNEEMKLVLLKKLRQSQMMKENVSTPSDAKAALAQLPSNTTATKLPATQPPPYRQDLSAKASASPFPAHFKASREYKQAVKAQSKALPLSESLSIQAQKHLKDRGAMLSSASSMSKSSLNSSSNLSALNALNNSISSSVDKVASTASSSNNGNAAAASSNTSNTSNGANGNLLSNLPAKLNLPFNLSREVEIIRKDSPSASSSPGPRDSPSQVSISKVRSSHHQPSSLTPSSTSPFPNKPSSSSHVSSSHREDGQSPAQRQAAARLALRKQLEKTLLRIPPPKPPPPEMHFIPNPSNTEFIYLLGLEQCVEYILHHSITDPKPTPFICTQCGTDFTPSWKWDRSKHKTDRNDTAKVDEPKVVCDQCVTNNNKQTLKQEHTNRLKAAFMKALQQEQEIEARLAQVRPSQPSPQPELNTGVSLTAVSVASTSARLPPSVSVTAVKPDYTQQQQQQQQQQHLSHRATSVAAQLHLQRERERHKEQERQRERDERERQREKERQREREREQREQQRKEDMFLPPGLTKQQKEQLMQNMNAAAAMASAMTNPAAIQQLQAAQAQLLRMQQGMGNSVAAAAAAAQQLPAAHMLAPYLLGPYNPFGMQQLQQLMAAQLGAVQAGASSSGSSSRGGSEAAGSSSSSSGGNKNMLQQHQELLRQAAEMQRQYFLDMIPTAGLHNQQQSHSKWKS